MTTPLWVTCSRGPRYAPPSVMRLSFLPALVGLTVLACSGGGGGSGGSDSGDGGAGPDVFCYSPTAKAPPSCSGYLNVPPASLDGIQQGCTEGDGQLVNACPTASLVGCCQALSDTPPSETCYYAGTPSDLESQCTDGEPNYSWSTTSF